MGSLIIYLPVTESNKNLICVIADLDADSDRIATYSFNTRGKPYLALVSK